MSATKDLFISYGRRESLGFVGFLHCRLRLAGYDVWFDKVNIPDGEDYAMRINHGIETAHNFAYIMAPRCMTSPYSLIELEYARLLGKRVIPVNQMVVFEVPEYKLSTAEREALDNFYTQYDMTPGRIQTAQDILNRSHALIGKTDWLDAKEQLSSADCDALAAWAQTYENHWSLHEDLDYLRKLELPHFGQSIDDPARVLERLLVVIERRHAYVHCHTEILNEALHWQRNQQSIHHLLVGGERLRAQDWLLTVFSEGEQAPCFPIALQADFICESRKNSENLMSDAFLCHTDEDVAAGRAIIRKLTFKAVTCWSYERDIHTGEAQSRSIESGIAHADNFLYLISPATVASKECQQQLALALAYNKRIIPLLVVDTPEENIPADIRSLQCIDMCSADADKDFDSLFRLLENGKSYFNRHKVLLAMALKWQAENHKHAFLLRGHNLANALLWLRLNREREQYPPLKLHKQFILASESAKGQLNTEVFISYSRKDGDFARKLNLALQEAGKSTWFDQESISSGVDFEKEIFKGIDGADNFIFIISPDSVNSSYCEREVNYAADAGKRFIPVLCRDTAEADIPETLRKINWVDFTSGRDEQQDRSFDKSFPELVQAIELDRDYARQHTILQQRAGEWEENERSADFLLNASACIKAETSLEEAEKYDKQPRPTLLQKDYVKKSRAAIDAEEKAVSQRRRTEFIVVTVGMVVALLLAVFSWAQTEKAEQHLRDARKNLYHAKAREYTEINPTLALRLGEKALHLAPADESIQSTLASIYAKTGNYYGEPLVHNTPVNDAAFSVDNRILAAAAGSRIWIWDRKTGKIIEKRSEHNAGVNTLEFSPDGEWLLSASDDGTARLWRNGKDTAYVLESQAGPLHSAFFSPLGSHVATFAKSGQIQIWRANDGKLIGRIGENRHVVSKAVFSPGSQAILVGFRDGSVELRGLDGSLRQAYEKQPAAIYDLVFSPDGISFLAATKNGAVGLYDTENGFSAELEREECKQEACSLKRVVFDPFAAQVIAVFGNGLIYAWDKHGNGLTLYEGDSRVWHVAIAPAGDRLLITYDYDVLVLWDLAEGLKGKIRPRYSDNAIRARFSPNGRLAASMSLNNNLVIWNVSGETPAGMDVYDFLDSGLLAGLSLSDEVFAGAMAVGELSHRMLSEEIRSNISIIIKFYEQQARRMALAHAPDEQRNYLLQALILADRIGPASGHNGMSHGLKQALAESGHADALMREAMHSEKEGAKDKNKSKEPFWNLEMIPLLLLIFLLLTVFTLQYPHFKKHQAYLQFFIYMAISFTVLSIWLSVYDGLYYYVSIVGGVDDSKQFWAFIHLLMSVAPATALFLMFNRERVRHAKWRYFLRSLCVLPLLFSLFLYPHFAVPGSEPLIKNEILRFLSLAGLANLILLPVLLGYYSLCPGKSSVHSRHISILVNYLLLFVLSLAIFFTFDLAISYYNPIPPFLRLLVLIAAGLSLGRFVFKRLQVYYQRGHFAVLAGNSLLYLLILYCTLLGFFYPGWQTLPGGRILFNYELSDALSLFWALSALPLTISYSIRDYKLGMFIKSSLQFIAALFLFICTAYYFRTYMGILPLITICVFGILWLMRSMSDYKNRAAVPTPV